MTDPIEIFLVVSQERLKEERIRRGELQLAPGELLGAAGGGRGGGPPGSFFGPSKTAPVKALLGTLKVTFTVFTPPGTSFIFLSAFSLSFPPLFFRSGGGGAEGRGVSEDDKLIE